MTGLGKWMAVGSASALLLSACVLGTQAAPKGAAPAGGSSSGTGGNSPAPGDTTIKNLYPGSQLNPPSTGQNGGGSQSDPAPTPPPSVNNGTDKGNVPSGDDGPQPTPADPSYGN